MGCSSVGGLQGVVWGTQEEEETARRGAETLTGNVCMCIFFVCFYVCACMHISMHTFCMWETLLPLYAWCNLGSHLPSHSISSRSGTHSWFEASPCSCGIFFGFSHFLDVCQPDLGLWSVKSDTCDSGGGGPWPCLLPQEQSELVQHRCADAKPRSSWDLSVFFPHPLPLPPSHKLSLWA